VRGTDDEVEAGSDIAFTVSSPAMEPSHPEGSTLAPRTSRVPALREPDHRERRWRLARDLAVFQAKLLVDGLKDLVLAPVSLVAALVGVLLHRDDPGRPFYALLRWGHGFDRWVNLFGRPRAALPPAAAPNDPITVALSSNPGAGEGLDAYVARIERVLVEQYRRGGLTAKAKDAIDEAIDGLQERGKRPPD
jgi:hypothetical protein